MRKSHGRRGLCGGTVTNKPTWIVAAKVKGKRAAARAGWSWGEASLAAAVELVNEWRRLARRLANSLTVDGGRLW